MFLSISAPERRSMLGSFGSLDIARSTYVDFVSHCFLYEAVDFPNIDSVKWLSLHRADFEGPLTMLSAHQAHGSVADSPFRFLAPQRAAFYDTRLARATTTGTSRTFDASAKTKLKAHFPEHRAL